MATLRGHDELPEKVPAAIEIPDPVIRIQLWRFTRSESEEFLQTNPIRSV